MKLNSMSALKKLTQICRKQHIIYPAESKLNNNGLTCYKYGPYGLNLKQNIIDEWWKAVLLKGKVIKTSELDFDLPSGVAFNRGNILQASWSQEVIDQCYQAGLSHFKRQIPFSIAGQGTYANKTEAATGSSNLLFNSSQVEELYIHHFTTPKSAAEMFDLYTQHRLHWWKQFAATPSHFNSNTSLTNSESLREVVIQFAFPWGWDTVETIQDVGCERLKHQQTLSGVSNQGVYRDQMVLPAQIVSSVVVERGLLAFLLDAFTPTDPDKAYPDQSNSEDSYVFRLHTRLAPFQVAMVTSLDVREAAGRLAAELSRVGIAVKTLGDPDSDVEELLTRSDRLGIPWAVILTRGGATRGIGHLRARDVGILEPVILESLVAKLELYTQRPDHTGRG